jgi:hypothetical protein
MRVFESLCKSVEFALSYPSNEGQEEKFLSLGFYLKQAPDVVAEGL